MQGHKILWKSSPGHGINFPIFLKISAVNASHTFYTAHTNVPIDPSDPMSRKVKTRPLNQTIHPEEKRRIIGDTFMKVEQ